MPYNDVVNYVLQINNFVNPGGQIYRRANNVLIYLKDGTCPEVDGSGTSNIFFSRVFTEGFKMNPALA